MYLSTLTSNIWIVPTTDLMRMPHLTQYQVFRVTFFKTHSYYILSWRSSNSWICCVTERGYGSGCCFSDDADSTWSSALEIVDKEDVSSSSRWVPLKVDDPDLYPSESVDGKGVDWNRTIQSICKYIYIYKVAELIATRIHEIMKGTLVDSCTTYLADVLIRCSN